MSSRKIVLDGVSLGNVNPVAGWSTLGATRVEIIVRNNDPVNAGNFAINYSQQGYAPPGPPGVLFAFFPLAALAVQNTALGEGTDIALPQEMYLILGAGAPNPIYMYQVTLLG